jgi:hypothetical protein
MAQPPLIDGTAKCIPDVAALSGYNGCPPARTALLPLLDGFSIVRRRFGMAGGHAAYRVDIQRGKAAARRRNDRREVNATHATHQKVCRTKPETVATQLSLVAKLK